jgi:hypothetical protein
VTAPARLLEALCPRAFRDVLDLEEWDAVDVELRDDLTIVAASINGEPLGEDDWTTLARSGLVRWVPAPFPSVTMEAVGA